MERVQVGPDKENVTEEELGKQLGGVYSPTEHLAVNEVCRAA